MGSITIPNSNFMGAILCLRMTSCGIMRNGVRMAKVPQRMAVTWCAHCEKTYDNDGYGCAVMRQHGGDTRENVVFMASMTAQGVTDTTLCALTQASYVHVHKTHRGEAGMQGLCRTRGECTQSACRSLEAFHDAGEANLTIQAEKSTVQHTVGPSTGRNGLRCMRTCPCHRYEWPREGNRLSKLGSARTDQSQGNERDRERTRTHTKDQEKHLIMTPAALAHAGRTITSSDMRSSVPKTANINLLISHRIPLP